MSSKLWLAGAFAAGSVLLAADKPSNNVRVVEEIVAKVNGDIITRGELLKQRAIIQAELEKQGAGNANLSREVDQKAADALRDQIDQLLLVQKGKDLNINVDADVNRRIAEIQSQSKLSDVEKFHEWLHEQTGETFEDFRQQMKNQLLTQRVVGQEVSRNINIPKAELEKYYNEHKSEFIRQEMVLLREILVSSGDNSPAVVAAAEKKAKDLVARARKGEKFGELARQYSDAATAQNDGELGAFKRGELKRELEDIVFKQNKGYVTDPVRTANGFEILRVEERYAAGQASFDEVQNEIMEKLFMPRMQPKVREYLTKLRQEAFLEIKPGYIDSGAAPGKDTTWRDPAQLKPETTTKEEVAARKKKKFMGVIPHGTVGKLPSDTPAAPPTVTPVPQSPVPAEPK